MRISDWSSDVCSSDLLIVMTRSGAGVRTYTFELTARRGGIGARSADTFFKVAFRYPREEAAAAQAAAIQAAYAQAVALQSGAIRSALDLSVLEGRRNLKYTVQGSSAIQRSEEHTSELQSLMRSSYAVFCLKKKKKQHHNKTQILKTTS